MNHHLEWRLDSVMIPVHGIIDDQVHFREQYEQRYSTINGRRLKC